MDAKQIDWAQILREINQHDTWENIAWHLEMTPTNIRKTIMTGGEPKYSIGITILEMYEKLCGKKDTPMKK